MRRVALMYYDGANLNPMLGIARPGDMGFGRDAYQSSQDILHASWWRRTRQRAGGRAQRAGMFPARTSGLSSDDGTFAIRTIAASRSEAYRPRWAIPVCSPRAGVYHVAWRRRAEDGRARWLRLQRQLWKGALRDSICCRSRVVRYEFVFDGLRDSRQASPLDAAKRL